MRNFIIFIISWTLLTFFSIPVLIIQSIRLEKRQLNDWYLLLAKNQDYVCGTFLFLSDAKTISANVGKLAIEKGGKYLVFEKIINWIFQDDSHCRDAYLKEFPQ